MARKKTRRRKVSKIIDELTPFKNTYGKDPKKHIYTPMDYVVKKTYSQK